MKRLVTLAVVVSLVATAGMAIEEAPHCQSAEEILPALLAQKSPIPAGDSFEISIDSPHPYFGLSTTKPQLVYSREIHHPGASFISPHFSRFELAKGDYVIVRSPDYSRSWRYEGYGKQDRGRQGGGGFWAIHISGERAIVELWAKGPEGAFGFSIDRYGRGFSDSDIQVGEPEAICTDDDKENAVCYENTEPQAYEKAKAVARLLVRQSPFQSVWCTGWLLGDEGHLMTNWHCIEDATMAGDTVYEFMAEGATCSTDCPQGACDGTIEADTGTLIQSNDVLDFALVKLPGNLSTTYGFFQLRETGPVLEERIYSPQHPSGRGKEIAVFSTYPENPSGFAEMDSLSEDSCFGGPDPDVGYFMDTEGGSSGSPVLGYSDDLVVALHHCRGSGSCNTGTGIDDPNTGVPTPLIITSLGANLPNNAIGSGEEIFADGFESGDVSAWSSSVP